ncbi:MAG: 2-oxo acid dehydrogenase subunit E2, partial [Acidimicrobiales bacterium]
VRRSTAERADALRAATAALMARSKREIPHSYLSRDVDLGAALGWMAEQNAGRPAARRLLPAALLLKAAARAARRCPRLNGFWLDDAFQPAEEVNLGVAVALRGGGLVAPALPGADGLSLDELMAALRDLVTRARAGRLRASEVSSPTITVTNLGDAGAGAVFGVISPPQVALIGFGAVRERPWAERGMLTVRPVVTATLSADHRASDGRQGAALLAALDDALQQPEGLQA